MLLWKPHVKKKLEGKRCRRNSMIDGSELSQKY